MTIRRRLRQRLRPALRQRQSPAVRLAVLLETSDADAVRTLTRLSDDPLYAKLRALGVIVYRRRAGFGLYWRAVPLDEGSTGACIAAPVPGLEPEVAARVKALGRERFERLFLADPPPTDETLAAASGLSVEDVRAVRRCLDEAALVDEVHGGAAAGRVPGYRRTAHIVADAEQLTVLMCNPHLARGDIVVRRDVFDAAVRAGMLDAAEVPRAAEILRYAEDLGRRASLLFRILEELVSIQRRFLQTGRDEDLEACSRRELARRLRVHQSLVARAVAGRSIVLPSGREVPLPSLLPSSAAVAASRVAWVLSDGVRRTDRQLQRELFRRFGVAMPRRTVAYHRRRISGAV